MRMKLTYMGMHLAGVTPSHGVKYRIYADAPKVTGIRNSQNGVFFASVVCFSNLETATKRFDAEFYAQRSMRAKGSEPNLPVIVVTPIKCIPILTYMGMHLAGVTPRRGGKYHICSDAPIIA